MSSHYETQIDTALYLTEKISWYPDALNSAKEIKKLIVTMK